MWLRVNFAVSLDLGFHMGLFNGATIGGFALLSS